MKYYSTAPGKRLAALLLALSVFLSLPLGALAAEDGESPASGQEEASFSQVSPSLPETEPEAEGKSELLEQEAAALDAMPLLLTGGHKTYMSGYPGAQFLPNREMTRAEAAQTLYNLLAAKPAVTSSQFSDVSLSSWYGTAVNTLAKQKVISGYSDGTFSPGKTISRAEFVTALSKCFSMPEGSSSFSDVPETFWAYPYISAATSNGWISGVGDGLFEPNRGIKRCEATAVLNAALQRMGDGFAAGRDTQKFSDVPKSHWAYLHITEAAEPVDAQTPEPSGDFKVGQTLRVVASGLNLRSQPTTASQSVTVLGYGSVLTVTDVSSLPWLGVKTSNGQTGFVHSGSSDDPYVEAYTPGLASGASLSNSTLSMHQYQSARLDAAVTSGSVSSMSWTSSDPSVAIVGYSLNYKGTNDKEQGAIVYGKKPGTATLTFSDSTGKSKASCKVTVTAPEPVRFAYSSENSAVKGENFDLIAVTDTGKTSVTFQIVDGPATGSFSTDKYTTESRTPNHSSLPVNTVRVFKRTVAFQAAGTYTVRASAGGGSGYYQFKVFVKPGAEGVNTSAYGERWCSTEGLKIIANFEGGVPEIEDDSIAAKNPTVGFGTVIQKGEAFYNNMTSTELFAFLAQTTNYGGYSAAVNRFRQNNNLKMTQAQFDALVSLVFNCGAAPLDTSEYNLPRVMLNTVAPPSGISESQSYPGTANIGDTVMYKEANLSSAAVTTVPHGDRVTVIGTQTVAAKHQLWYKVRYNSKTGWVPAGYINLDTSGLVHDLAYADAASLSNNFLQWHKSGGCIYGLLTRRLAECKIFFFGNYADAYHSSPNYEKNTYGFNYPSCEKEYE